MIIDIDPKLYSALFPPYFWPGGQGHLDIYVKVLRQSFKMS